MKTIIKLLFATLLISGTAFTASAQQMQSQVDQKPGKYEVRTQLVEKIGTYDQRMLYREFLEEYMKNCPYISHFKVQQAVGTDNTHDVVWTYEVNGWNDITKFYSWINDQVKSSKDDGLKMALRPYEPDYAIGGQIQVQKRSKSELAKDKAISNNSNS